GASGGGAAGTPPGRRIQARRCVDWRAMVRRRAVFASALLLAVVASACGSVTQPTPNDPTLVQVDGGTVRGKVADGLFVYKGIPFAAPPVGALRWRAPQPVKSWDGVLEAADYAPDPMQPAEAGSP